MYNICIFRYVICVPNMSQERKTLMILSRM